MQQERCASSPPVSQITSSAPQSHHPSLLGPPHVTHVRVLLSGQYKLVCICTKPITLCLFLLELYPLPLQSDPRMLQAMTSADQAAALSSSVNLLWWHFPFNKEERTFNKQPPPKDSQLCHWDLLVSWTRRKHSYLLLSTSTNSCIYLRWPRQWNPSRARPLL